MLYLDVTELGKRGQIKIGRPQKMKENKVRRRPIGDAPATQIEGRTLEDEDPAPAPHIFARAAQKEDSLPIGPVVQDGFDGYEVGGSWQGVLAHVGRMELDPIRLARVRGARDVVPPDLADDREIDDGRANLRVAPADAQSELSGVPSHVDKRPDRGHIDGIQNRHGLGILSGTW